MIRSLLMLGLLGGAGWYAYRKLKGSGTGAVEPDHEPSAANLEPPEARAAAMAGMPAVQPPATISEP